MTPWSATIRHAIPSGGAVNTPAPELFPLQLLRAGMGYLEILGSLFAVSLGCGLIA